jgi:carboxymethylenebutenolidase
MDHRKTGEDGGRRRKTEKVAAGLAAVAAMTLAVAARSPSSSDFPRPSPSDVHAEYVKFLSGRDTITGYLAYPERRDPAPAVLVIHEIFGMSDFIRQTTEQLAKDGFVALAPDLLSRRGGTPASTDSARKLIAGLNPDTITLDLNAAAAYVKTLRAVRRDRVGVIGFCWGGAQSFRYATNNPDLRSFVVCYGTAPNAADMARIRAAGLGVYAENDARVDAGVADAAAAMKAAGKSYSYAIYPGVGHGFLRAREKPEVADSAWRTVVRFFRENLER